MQLQKKILLGVIFCAITYVCFNLIRNKEMLLNKYDKYDALDAKRDAELEDSLTNAELKLFKSCEANVMVRHRKKLKKFKSHKKICVAHHTYLRSGNKLLIEVGGNKGDDASAFQKLYKPRHILLEPMKPYFEKLKKKFADNTRITILNIGLAAETKNISIDASGKGGVATSIYAPIKKGSSIITVLNSTTFFSNIGVGSFEVDLLSLDCEGCEFDVLENMISANMTKYFKNIQMEWHPNLPSMPNYIARYCRIIQILSRTHRYTFQFRLVYESWRRKDLP